MKIIKYNEEVLAIIVNEFEDKNNKIEFYTKEENILQFGRMSHKSGHIIKPHIHTNYIRETNGTNEVIFIKKGVVEVDFYTKDQKLIQSEILSENTWVVLISGGHGFKIIEDSELFEVKNGPYAEEKDKTRFT
jgi:hypothetical protein